MLQGVFHLHEQEARQVMTPIPAVVTVDVADDVETALRRCISSGHTRLVVHRGREPRTASGAPCTPTRWPASSCPRARDASIEALRQGRADRPGDQATRRPAGRPPARAARRWPSSSTSTAASRASSRSRTSSRRSSARSTTRPTRPAASPPPGQRRLVRARPRRHRRPARPRHRRCRSTPTPTTRSAASSSTSSGACPSAGTPSTPTATRSASSRCARTASRPCGSAIVAGRRHGPDS